VARTRPSTGLRRVSVPVYVGGALDTKTNPKLVQPGSLLELENMYQLKTGELRLRNGFAAKTKVQLQGGASQTSISAIWADQKGVLNALAATAGGNTQRFTRFNPALNGWSAGGNQASRQNQATVSRRGIASTQGFAGAASQDLTDCDSAVAGGFLAATWSSQLPAALRARFDEASGGGLVADVTLSSGVASRSKMCLGGTTFRCLVTLVATTGDLSFTADNVSAVFIGAALVSIAEPWFDVHSIAGSNNILLAYRATAGGVSIREINPATGATVTGPVNIAAADATLALGILDDSLGTGSYLLATAGSTAGVVVRTLSAAFAVTATNVIDATATTGIRSITGHVNTGIANYIVLWDVDAAPTVNMSTKRGAWTGAAAVITLAPSFGLISKSFKGPDGFYYWVGSYDSAVQPLYGLMQADADAISGRAGFVATIMPGSAGGRLVTPGQLANVSVNAAGL